MGGQEKRAAVRRPPPFLVIWLNVRSGRRRHFLVALVAGATRAAARSLGLAALDRGDGRRQDVGGNPLLAFVLLLIFAGATRALATGTLLAAITPLTAPAPRRTSGTLLALVATVAAGRGHGFVLILVLVGRIIAALPALLLEAGAALIEDAEIMVRELEIIFGLNAIAGELRVAGHRFVFLVKLRGVTARAIVLAIACIGRIVRRAGPAAATAPAAALTIVDQS